MTDEIRNPNPPRVSVLALALLACVLVPVGAAAEEGGVEVTLPPPGVCATPRDEDVAAARGSFYVAGTPAEKLIAQSVSAMRGSQVLAPAHAPPAPPVRSPCDGVAGSCASTSSKVSESAPIPDKPKGVP